jgi:hypothetical protein
MSHELLSQVLRDTSSPAYCFMVVFLYGFLHVRLAIPDLVRLRRATTAITPVLVFLLLLDECHHEAVRQDLANALTIVLKPLRDGLDNKKVERAARLSGTPLFLFLDLAPTSRFVGPTPPPPPPPLPLLS